MKIKIILLCVFLFVFDLNAQAKIKLEQDEYKEHVLKVYELEERAQYHGDDPIIRYRFDLPPKVPSFDIWLKEQEVNRRKVTKTQIEQSQNVEPAILEVKAINNPGLQKVSKNIKTNDFSNDDKKPNLLKIDSYWEAHPYLIFIFSLFIFWFFVKVLLKIKNSVKNQRNYSRAKELILVHKEALKENWRKSISEYKTIDSRRWKLEKDKFIRLIIYPEFGDDYYEIEEKIDFLIEGFINERAPSERFNNKIIDLEFVEEVECIKNNELHIFLIQ
mgnify:CR=1 FL=1